MPILGQIWSFLGKKPFFTGEIKSFVTHITENPPKHLVHIGFWSDYGQQKQSNIWNMSTDEMFEKKRLGWQFLPNGTIVIPCAAHKNRVGAVFYGYPNMAFGSKQQFIQWKKAEKKKYESKGGNVQQCSSSGRCFVDDSEGYEAWINGGRDTWISNLQLQLASSNSGSGSKPVAQPSRTFTTPGINQNFTSNSNTFNL